MKYPRFTPAQLTAPVPAGPLRYESEGIDLQSRWSAEHLSVSGAEVEYWRLLEHQGGRHPLYREPLPGRRTFEGPYLMRAHVDLPSAMVEVGEKGYRATWTGSGYIARILWEQAVQVSEPPSEGDVLGIWVRDRFYQSEAHQGGTVHGAHLYYTVSDVSVAGSQFSSPTVVGWTVNLLRNTDFGAERRIERKAP
jgi:hypothetical protein